MMRKKKKMKELFFYLASNDRELRLGLLPRKRLRPLGDREGEVEEFEEEMREV